MSQKIPAHLKKYIVRQNWKKYSPQDQAVWRYIMRGIRRNMSLFGVSGGLEGLEKTGLTFHRIPKIAEVSAKLQKFGWRAVPVSGFIPPKAFMEFQLHGVLPIASEMRPIEHISYTPAPDIVHEAAGHVPFLTHPVFSRFLKKYARIVLKAITSAEDRAQYVAIRELSDLKENPRSAKAQIQKAERKLKAITENMAFKSEAARLSRFIWWTSEYGLMGSLKSPKIYGAGLISSIEEGAAAGRARKIRLSAKCLDCPYDITRFQPQLFVAEDFHHLTETLDRIAQTLSFKKGGLFGARQAVQSRTVNTVELESGLQISGRTESLIPAAGGQPAFIKFSGPCQLSFEGRELPGHGRDYHSHGYSSPMGAVSQSGKPLHLWSAGDLRREGVRIGRPARLKFPAGIVLEGEPAGFLRRKGRLLIIAFKACRVSRAAKGGRELLFDPSWGAFDLAAGGKAASVFAGPADPEAYGEKDDFQPSKPRPKKISPERKKTFGFFSDLESLRKKQSQGLAAAPLKAGGRTKSAAAKKAGASGSSGRRAAAAAKRRLGLLLKRLKRLPLDKESHCLLALELLELSKRHPETQEQILVDLKGAMKGAMKGARGLRARKLVKAGLPLYKQPQSS